MFSKTTKELSIPNTKLHDALKGESILAMNYCLLAIIGPNVLDSIKDEITYNRRIGICWDVHERFLFLFVCIVAPSIFIAFNDLETMPFVYVALEQSIVVSIFVIINSMITKLEKNKTIDSLAMIFSVVTCIIEVYGLFDTYYQDLGIQLSFTGTTAHQKFHLHSSFTHHSFLFISLIIIHPSFITLIIFIHLSFIIIHHHPSFIGTIFQFLIVGYWIYEIVSPKLRFIGSWSFDALMSLTLSSIEKTIIFYFLLFLLIILGLVISNA